MKRRWLAVSAVLLLLLLTLPGLAAEQVVEAWRSQFGHIGLAAANPTDGSCWITSGGSVMHLSGTGAVLSQSTPFSAPASLSVNPADGSCWVADFWASQVVHLSATGAELWRGDGFATPTAVSVNPTDGSCWVAEPEAGRVVHLSSAGEELGRIGGSARFLEPYQLSVNASDGSVWVTDLDRDVAVHLSSDGAVLARAEGVRPYALAVNPADGSVWVADQSSIAHLTSAGERIWQGSVLTDVNEVSVNAADGSCWVAGADAVVHLSAAGQELWRGAISWYASSVSVNATDGSCWVVDAWNDEVIRLSANGAELCRAGGIFRTPGPVSVNSADGSCWVVDLGNLDSPGSSEDTISHLAPDGSLLWRGGGLYLPYSISVSAGDGSCWVADTGHNQVVHLSSGGEEVWRGSIFEYPWSIASVGADPVDGSCWVAARANWDGTSYSYANSAVVHLAADGTERWRSTALAGPSSVAVDPNDGSCWVAAYGDAPGNGYVVHLAADGSELWRSEPDGTRFSPSILAIDAADGSCWAADRDGMVHFAADGTELWREPTGYSLGPFDSAVDPKSGSLWVATDLGLRRLASDGTELAMLDGFSTARSISINSTDGSCWVADTWHGQVAHLVIVPGAKFVGTPTSGAAPLTVAFTDYSSNAPAAWSWDFGDGATSVRRDPVHTYTAPGFYLAHLTVSGPGGSDPDVDGGWIAVGFPDTDPDSLAFDPIIACATAGIVTGFTDGLYHPDLAVTRGQMAAYIARAMCEGEENVPTGPATPTFSDVSADHNFYNHIEYAVAHGVVAGFSYDNTYRPQEPVTRGQMAAFLARAKCGGEEFVPSGPATPTFPDVAPDLKFYDHIEWIYSQGITTGKADGLYHPEEACLRDQMAVFIGRAFLGL